MSVKKIMIIVGGAILALAIVGFSVSQNQKSIVTVQTARVSKQDLLASYVTASGEVKPKTFVNIGANNLGRITRLMVKEGDRVKNGQVLAQLENVQSAADVNAMKATLQSQETDTLAAEAALKTANAQLKSSMADAARTRLDYDRAESLFKDKLIAKSEYDTKKAAWEVASAVEAQNQAHVSETKAQLDSSHGHINTARANLARVSDVLHKTTYTAPFDGVVTNLPVREGETVVPGIQNAPGSTLMTIADMKVITVEVQVDETDIVNVKLGQTSDITIDAIPGKIFKGEVTQIGDNAIIRSSGLATSQSNTSSQEAKDFKVTITLKDPPDNLRPGLSATAKITTGTKTDAITIPIQALTIRDEADLEAQKSKGPVKTAALPSSKKPKVELQGVFVVRNRKAEFVKVETGLTGTTEIEVKSGLSVGDDIITGSYKVLRTLRNGAGVKVDNSVIVKEES